MNTQEKKLRPFINRFHVGGRVLKTALAVTLAIYFTQLIGMERVTLAAIVALLTVQRTFYHSLLQSIGKLGSVFLGVILGTIFGYLFGVTPLAYGLVTLIMILLCLQLQWQDHIVLATVTAITVIFSGAADLKVYSLEQMLTALLGAASALVINYLFTPNHSQEVVNRLLKVETNLRQAIDFIIKEILEPGCDDTDFKEKVLLLQKEIAEGADVAKLLREEQRFMINRQTPSDRYRQAFHIFSSQLDRLEEMHKLARRMPVEVPQALPLVKLFRIVQAIQFNRLRGKRATYPIFEKAIENLDQRFAAMELPKSREEFISRASLFHLYQEIKRYYRRTQKIAAVISKEKGQLPLKKTP